MAPTPKIGDVPPLSGVTWRPTNIMNMRDLSKDDDFLSHLLVEKLGTGVVPLLVHKMDPSRRLPKTNADDLLQIVRRNMVTKSPLHHATRQAVDELLALPPVRYYLKSYTQKQINAFATHASRYFELYHPSGSIEIAHTSRYSHETGKSELCILATRPLPAGAVISELKGSMANLTEEEDKELKRTDMRNSDIRRDFSVIHSKQMKKNHLFLGPARFVNHDCNNNCELFREGKYITFRVIRPIAVGEEITAHYGDGYFGSNNCHCLCETCEKAVRGGYAMTQCDDEDHSGSDSESRANSGSRTGDTNPPLNVNERRTRRGVYAILQEEDNDSDESDNDETTMPLAEASDVPKDGEIELEAGAEVSSDSRSLSPSRHLSNPGADTFGNLGLLTPESLGISSDEKASSPTKTAIAPFKSIISTRRQKALAASQLDKNDEPTQGVQQLVTPPLTDDTASLAETCGSSLKRLTRSSASSSAPEKTTKTRGRKTKPPTPPSEGEKKGKGTKSSEEPELRVLRARPSLQANLIVSSQVSSATPDIPRGPDGKPLPICSTCSSILPVISVDSEVVWGLGIECSPKKGKKRKPQDCPRCMRHFAIYARPWPARIPHITAFLPTPRDGTPVEAPTKRVTDKGLSTLDRKLAAAAASAPPKPKHQDTVRPLKKRRTEQRGISDTPKRTSSAIRQRNERLAPVTKELPKRKRGRPRRVVPEILKTEEDRSKPEPVVAPNQPRNSNGRFGRKGYSRRAARHRFTMAHGNILSRAQRAIARGKNKLEHNTKASDKQEDSDVSGRKRGAPELDDSGRPSKKPRHSDDSVKDEPTFTLPRLWLTVKRPLLGLKGMGLLQAPNPLTFARRAWFSSEDSHPPKVDVDATATTSEDETDPPATPDDQLTQSAVVVDSDCESGHGDVSKRSTDGLPYSGGNNGLREVESIPSQIFPRASARRSSALISKPSPFNFAKRRWASMTTSPNQKRRPCCKYSSKSMPELNYATIAEGEKATDSEPNKTGAFSALNEELPGDSWSKDNESSSGEEDVIIPGSPDSSKFTLHHRASFESKMPLPSFGAVPLNLSDSQSVKQLVAKSCSTSTAGARHHEKHIFAPRVADTVVPKPSTFWLDLKTPPSFVDAGWDSCSDSSSDS